VAINEELIVKGYGPGFWARVDREACWTSGELYRLSFLQPKLQAWLKERQSMRDNRERRVGLKRHADDDASSQPRTKKRRRSSTLTGS